VIIFFISSVSAATCTLEDFPSINILTLPEAGTGWSKEFLTDKKNKERIPDCVLKYFSRTPIEYRVSKDERNYEPDSVKILIKWLLLAMKFPSYGQIQDKTDFSEIDVWIKRELFVFETVEDEYPQAYSHAQTLKKCDSYVYASVCGKCYQNNVENKCIDGDSNKGDAENLIETINKLKSVDNIDGSGYHWDNRFSEDLETFPSTEKQSKTTFSPLNAFILNRPFFEKAYSGKEVGIDSKLRAHIESIAINCRNNPLIRAEGRNCVQDILKIYLEKYILASLVDHPIIKGNKFVKYCDDIEEKTNHKVFTKTFRRSLFFPNICLLDPGFTTYPFRLRDKTDSHLEYVTQKEVGENSKGIMRYSKEDQGSTYGCNESGAHGTYGSGRQSWSKKPINYDCFDFEQMDAKDLFYYASLKLLADFGDEEAAATLYPLNNIAWPKE